MTPCKRSRLKRLCPLFVLIASVATLSALRAQTTPTGEAPPPAKSQEPSVIEKKKISVDDPKASTSGEAVQLSPFEVNADDEGYNAANSMSLTRVNSKVSDLGASLNVVTKQQLIDTAAVDINDIFLYESNTQGTGQFTSTSVDVNGLTVDNVQDSPQTSNRIRGGAAADISVGGFSANSRIPIDTYNLDSVEINRGPNSNLAGLGGGAGTVNVNQAQGNLSRETTQVTARGDNWGGYRSTLNFNRPLIKGRLALFAAALYEDKGFVRKPSNDLQRRQYLAMTAKPFRSTTIHASAEFISDNRRTPNAVTPRDTITSWLQAGKPTWDPVTYTATVNGVKTQVTRANDGLLPAGLGIDSTQYTRPTMYIDGGQVQLWMPNSIQTSGSNPSTVGSTTNQRTMGTFSDISKNRSTLYPLFLPPSISDKSLYDWDKINFSATNWNRDKAAIYTASLDQAIVNTTMHKLYADVAYRKETSSTYDHNLIGTTSFLYLDINERLLDGRPNPYFLRPYVTVWEPTIRNQTDLNDQTRAQLYYGLDLSHKKSPWVSWIGRQNLVGFYETRFTTIKTFNSREAVLDPHTWVSSTNYANGSATGRVSYKYYLGDNQGYNVDYAPPRGGTALGYYNFHYLSDPTTAKFIDEPALFGETPYTASRTRNNLWTRGTNLQSFFFGDRLVTLFGYRRDNKGTRGSPATVADPATGLYNWHDVDIQGWNGWSWRSGNTKTTDFVLRPFKGIHTLDRKAAQEGVAGFFADSLRNIQFTYNRSASFNPTTGTPQKNLEGELLGEPNGVTVDKGIRAEFFKGKLVVDLKWYKQTNINARVSGGASTAVGRTVVLDTGTSSFSLYPWARNVVLLRPSSVGKTDAQIIADTYTLMQLPNGWFDQFSGFNTTDTNDVTSTGKELNVTAQPIRGLRLKFTGAQTRTVNSNLSNVTEQWIEQRMPAWLSIKDDQGNLWWTSTTANVWFANFITPSFKLSRALLGLSSPEIPTYSAAGLANYDFREGRFKGVGIGTAIRWVDKNAIGFYGLPDSDGIMRSYDVHRPIYQKGRTSYDFNASYALRLLSDKIRMKIQLNVRDAFAHQGLRAIQAQPDGSPANFRIIDGPQYILTTTFDL